MAFSANIADVPCLNRAHQNLPYIQASAAQRERQALGLSRYWRSSRKMTADVRGMVVKAGLVELTDDGRATLSGAFLTVYAKLSGDDREQALLQWKRKGKRAFEEREQS